MRIGLFSAAVGSMMQEKRLGVISNNMANVDTPGYKRESIHFRDYIYESTYTQLDQGRVHQSDSSLDVALVGDGYLKVQTDSGVLYTRAGNLTLNGENVLTTQDGLPVLGQNGPITLPGPDVRIERNGQIFDKDNVPIDTLSMVQFGTDSRLEKVNNGYFKPADGQAQELPAETVSVQQGFLESSNFNVVEEMARMIDTIRAFEAYEKTMQAIVEQDSSLISKCGSL